MRLKDYYRVLGVPATATAEEIRKSFRSLAKKHHPDRNPDSPFAAGHFMEIKEAYQVLGDERQRYRYDEERWLLGMSSRSPAGGKLNAEWVRGEAARLRKHMEGIDTYRMDHGMLQQYVLQLLSDAHLAVVANSPLMPALVADMLVAVSGLKRAGLPPVMERLKLLAGKDDAAQAAIASFLEQRVLQQQKRRRFRLGVVLFLLIVSLAAIFILNI